MKSKGSVLYQVLQFIQGAERFTNKEIATTLEINPNSIRTVIKRLKEQELIEDSLKQPESKGRGAPEKTYCVVDSEEARDKISERIQEYTFGNPESEYPSSPHFFAAKEKINKYALDNSKKESDKKQILYHLNIALSEEGGKQANINIRAFILLEWARFYFAETSKENEINEILDFLIKHLDELKERRYFEERIKDYRGSLKFRKVFKDNSDLFNATLIQEYISENIHLIENMLFLSMLKTLMDVDFSMLLKDVMNSQLAEVNSRLGGIEQRITQSHNEIQGLGRSAEYAIFQLEVLNKEFRKKDIPTSTYKLPSDKTTNDLLLENFFNPKKLVVK